MTTPLTISAIKSHLNKLPLLVCIALFIFHFSFIYRYAVNIPNSDDWAMFYQDDHPASLDLPWLYIQHNEHRTTTTKFFVWLQFQINGWNVRTHQLIDFLIYGFFLVFLAWFAHRFKPHVTGWAAWSFLFFLLSPIIWLEHFMAYPVAVHFWIAFFFASASLLFSDSQSWPTLISGAILSTLSIYSFAAGVVTSLLVLIAFCLFKAVRALKANETTRRREILQVLAVCGLVGGALLGWSLAYKPPAENYLFWPYHLDFWRFFLNLVSFSFGVDRYNSKVGAICFLIVMAPICIQVWRTRGKLSNAQWASFALVIALLANFCAITMGRHNFGPAWAKTQEYAEHGMPLIILSVINWSLLLKDHKILKNLALGVLWVFCFSAFSNNWNFEIYRQNAASRADGYKCVEAYYKNLGKPSCPTIFSGKPPRLFWASRPGKKVECLVCSRNGSFAEVTLRLR